MEFQIITDLSALPSTIDFNFDAMKAELDTKLEQYRSLVVTEDSIKEAAKDRAALNKLSQAIDARRREVKKQCLTPYESFEAKCKELTGMIGQASRSIDQQIKAFEEQEKAYKLDKIKANYHPLMGWLATFIPFEQVMDPKWLNKSTSLASANKALEERTKSIIADVETIQSMKLTHETAALSCYYETLDLSAAMAENLRLSKLALAQDQQQPPKSEPTAPADPPAPVQPYAPDVEPEPPEEPKTIKVIFYDTTAAFRAEMRALTEKYGVKYGGIK